MVMAAVRNPARNPVDHRRSGYRWVPVRPVWAETGWLNLTRGVGWPCPGWFRWTALIWSWAEIEAWAKKTGRLA